jgi:hypothetical protein
MKTEVIEQEQVKKKEVAVGAGALILLLLIAFAFAKKKKDEEPPPGEGEPEVKVIGIGWEGSPQTPTITKFQGESFSALIDIENNGGAGSVSFELGIGYKTLFIHNDKGNSPWTASFNCPIGKAKLKMTASLSTTFPAAPDNPYDAWVKVQGKYYEFPTCFTVKGLAPEITVLSISWL